MNEVITFGCRLNTYESEIIKDNLIKAGRENVFVVHSCAVTNEAERQVKQQIRKIHKDHPNSDIIVVGCAVQLDPVTYAQLPGVTKVLGNADKLKYENYLTNSNSNPIQVSDINQERSLSSHLVSNFTDKSRAFIEIQNGCNHSCTFCAITHARGNNRSLPIEKIIEQISLFLNNDYKEIVFTGVDITDYGIDLFGEPSLGKMLLRVLKNFPQLPRIRLSSIDVAEIDNDLFQLITCEPRLMPHFHLSLQSGNNLILKRMKRRHSREDAIEFCHKIQSLRKEVVFGADIIVGFPTETDIMFQDTVDLIHQINIPYLHIFPYSPKVGTPAAKMPQIPLNIRKNRAAFLREISQQKLSNFYQSLLNTTQRVVVEQKNIGRAENFAVIHFNNPEISTKSIVNLNVNAFNEGILSGSVVE